jgi:predicted transposase YbfD/YdcC
MSAVRRDSMSSLGRDAPQLAERVRGHWAIEHALHGVLDSALREDDCRLRQGPAPEHFVRLRRIAFNRLKQDTTNRHGLKVQRNRAGWDQVS